MLYLNLASRYDHVTTEYYIHNFGSITAAVGGAMGLFLGISLFKVLLSGLEIVFAKLKPSTSRSSSSSSSKTTNKNNLIINTIRVKSEYA